MPVLQRQFEALELGQQWYQILTKFGTAMTQSQFESKTEGQQLFAVVKAANPAFAMNQRQFESMTPDQQLFRLYEAAGGGGGAIPPIVNIDVVLDGRDFSATWDAVPGALGYQVRINGGGWIDVDTNEYAGEFEDYGTNNFEVRSVMPSNPALDAVDTPEPAGAVFTEIQKTAFLSPADTEHAIVPDQPITAGSLLVILFEYMAVPAKILGIDVGGEAVEIHALWGADPAGTGGNGCYVYPSEATAGPIVVTIDRNVACNIAFWEVAVTGATPELDVAVRSYATGVNPQSQPATNSSANIAIFGVAKPVFPATITNIAAPYLANALFEADFVTFATYNKSSIAQATFTNSNGATRTTMAMVAFGADPAVFKNQLLCDFSAGVEGASTTEAALQASTFGINIGQWSNIPASGADMKFGAVAAGFRLNQTPRLPNGMRYPPGAGSMGIIFDTDEVQSGIKLDFASNGNYGIAGESMSAQILLFSDIPANDSSNCDTFAITGKEGGSTDFLNCKYIGNPSADGVHRAFQAEVATGGGTHTVLVPISTFLKLHITYNKTGNMVFVIHSWNGSAWVLVDTILELSAGACNPSNIAIGQTASSTTPPPGHFIWFGQLQVNFDGEQIDD